MKLWKLPLKILALPLMLVLFLVSLLGKLATNLSAYVVGLFMFLMLLLGVFCAWQQQWNNVIFLVVIEAVCAAVQFGAMFLAEIIGEWSASLYDFIHS